MFTCHVNREENCFNTNTNIVHFEITSFIMPNAQAHRLIANSKHLDSLDLTGNKQYF